MKIRIKRFLLGRIIQDTQSKISFLGYTFEVVTFSDFYWTFIEVFIDDDYYFSTKNPKPFVVNLGANIGVDELYFKWLYPDAKILSFEALPENATLLEKNIVNNNFDDIVIEAKAVGVQEGVLNMYGDRRAASLSSSLVESHGGSEYTGKCVEVPVVRLSGYLSDKTVDLLKIDIEGSEAQVINELATANVLKNVDQLVIEFHHFGSVENKLSEIIKALEESSFSITFKSDYRALQDIPENNKYYFMLYARNQKTPH